MAGQLALPLDLADPVLPPATFVDNMRVPVHRWFRYSAGYSAAWARTVIRAHRRTHPDDRVLDPFAGSGTTLLAADAEGAKSIGLEPHPFVLRVARAKLAWGTNVEAFVRLARAVKRKADTLPADIAGYPSIIRRSFTDESLATLHRLRIAWSELQDDSEASALTWLALAAILRRVSHVGTAPWQYLLPSKRKQRPADPLEAFQAQVRTMAEDMRDFAPGEHSRAELIEGDARDCGGVEPRSIGLVLTSPPYANNYDYADATRLEMTFFGEVTAWGDLQTTVRHRLVRSCSQHVSERSVNLGAVLSRPELAPIVHELEQACRTLARVRLTRGGRKSYHLMVATYFLDLARTWRALGRVCVEGATCGFVIGDSAPYGIYLPVVRWFQSLAEAGGFASARFEKTRDRNVKWLNRKHRVPLLEGNLWVTKGNG